jgi:hypothetical protein
VPEQLRNDFEIDPAGQHEGRRGVAEVMEAHRGSKGTFGGYLGR